MLAEKPLAKLRFTEVENKGYVLTDDRDEPHAIILNYQMFKTLVERLEDLEDTLDAMEAWQEYKENPSTARPWDEIRAELITEGLWDE